MQWVSPKWLELFFSTWTIANQRWSWHTMMQAFFMRPFHMDMFCISADTSDFQAKEMWRRTVMCYCCFQYVGTREFSKKMCDGSFYLFLFKYALSHKLLYTKVVYFVKMEVSITKKEPENKKYWGFWCPSNFLFIVTQILHITSPNFGAGHQTVILMCM